MIYIYNYNRNILYWNFIRIVTGVKNKQINEQVITVIKIENLVLPIKV